MCEAFVRTFAGDRFEVESSGIEAGHLNPLVVKAMEEIGISMEGHYAKPAQGYVDRAEAFDYVVTVCDEANAERCPIFPTTGHPIHWPFPDPSALSGTHDEQLASIRLIRDEIERAIRQWLTTH
jgi:arsenate reductase